MWDDRRRLRRALKYLCCLLPNLSAAASARVSSSTETPQHKNLKVSGCARCPSPRACPCTALVQDNITCASLLVNNRVVVMVLGFFDVCVYTLVSWKTSPVKIVSQLHKHGNIFLQSPPGFSLSPSQTLITSCVSSNRPIRLKQGSS